MVPERPFVLWCVSLLWCTTSFSVEEMIPYTLGGTTVLIDKKNIVAASPLLRHLREGMAYRNPLTKLSFDGGISPNQTPVLSSDENFEKQNIKATSTSSEYSTGGSSLKNVEKNISPDKNLEEHNLKTTSPVLNSSSGESSLKGMDGNLFYSLDFESDSEGILDLKILSENTPTPSGDDVNVGVPGTAEVYAGADHPKQTLDPMDSQVFLDFLWEQEVGPSKSSQDEQLRRDIASRVAGDSKGHTGSSSGIQEHNYSIELLNNFPKPGEFNSKLPIYIENHDSSSNSKKQENGFGYDQNKEVAPASPMHQKKPDDPNTTRRGGSSFNTGSESHVAGKKTASAGPLTSNTGSTISSSRNNSHESFLHASGLSSALPQYNSEVSMSVFENQHAGAQADTFLLPSYPIPETRVSVDDAISSVVSILSDTLSKRMTAFEVPAEGDEGNQGLEDHVENGREPIAVEGHKDEDQHFSDYSSAVGSVSSASSTNKDKNRKTDRESNRRKDSTKGKNKRKQPGFDLSHLDALQEALELGAVKEEQRRQEEEKRRIEEENKRKAEVKINETTQTNPDINGNSKIRKSELENGQNSVVWIIGNAPGNQQTQQVGTGTSIHSYPSSFPPTSFGSISPSSTSHYTSSTVTATAHLIPSPLVTLSALSDLRLESLEFRHRPPTQPPDLTSLFGGRDPITILDPVKASLANLTESQSSPHSPLSAINFPSIPSFPTIPSKLPPLIAPDSSGTTVNPAVVRTPAPNNTMEKVIATDGVKCEERTRSGKCKSSDGSVIQKAKPEYISKSDCSCGVRFSNKVMRNLRLKRNEFPWMARLLYARDEIVYCGGSIIDDLHILTSAHCVSSVNASSIQVQLGSAHLRRGEIFSVKKIIVHPKFKNNPLKWDLAIIKLTREIQFSFNKLPICLAREESEETYINKEAVVMGWGINDVQSYNLSTCSSSATAQIRKLNECVYNESYEESSSERLMCISNDATSACQGNGGGPVAYNTGSYFELIGVVSWSISCESNDHFDVYPRVASHGKWIRRNTMGGTRCRRRTVAERLRQLKRKNDKRLKIDNLALAIQRIVETMRLDGEGSDDGDPCQSISNPQSLTGNEDGSHPVSRVSS